MNNDHLLRGKRILFACVPGDGHFNPLTGLAMHLRSLGCDVRWYASRAYENKLQRLSIPFYPFTKALDVPSDKIDEVFPERKHIKNQVRKLNFDMINYFILRSTEYLADIKDIHKEWPVDAIVADCVFSAIPFIKKELNLPVISIGVLPLIQTSKDLAPPGLGMEPAPGILGKIRQDMLRKLADHVLFKKPNQLFFSLMAQLQIPPNGSNAFDALVNSATLFLQSGTPGLEYQRSDLGANIRFLGPLLPYEHKDKGKQPWYDARLSQYKKVILVTQGTVEKDVEKLLVPAMEAFKNRNDILLVVTTGDSQAEALRKRFPYKNVIIEDFIAFDDIMPHTHLFISNGGFGGVMQGIRHALPMIVAGVHEGKNEVNARVGYFKYGINLKTEKPSPDQLRNAVEKIFGDISYQKNIDKLCEEFKVYKPLELFEGYLQGLLCQPVVPAGAYRLN